MIIWSDQYGNWEQEETLTTHKCNETDKKLFYNFDYIQTIDIEDYWSQFFCLDNPEKIFLRDGQKEKSDISLWIEAWACSDKPNCKT